MTEAAANDTRSLLLQATIDVIESSGEAGVRVDRIAEAVGVSKASVYHFFGDRDGLVVAALSEAYSRMMRGGLVPLQALLECDTRDDFIALLVADIPSFITPEGALARRRRMQILGSAVTRPALQAEIRAVHRESVAELSKFVAYGQRRGWVSRRFDPDTLAEWWFGLLLGRHLLDTYGARPDAPDWLEVTFTAVRSLIVDEP